MVRVRGPFATSAPIEVWKENLPLSVDPKYSLVFSIWVHRPEDPALDFQGGNSASLGKSKCWQSMA